MLALCLVKLGKSESAKECLTNAKTLYENLGLQDIELEEAMDEVKRSLDKIKPKEEKKDAEMKDEDGWESYGEEEFVSDDEK